MSKKLENLKWNSVSIDGFPTSSMSNLQGFVALEECKDYGLEKSNKQSKKRRSQNKKQKEVPTKKMKLDNGFIVENCKQVTPSLTNEKLNHESRKSKKNKKNERNSEMRETKNDKPLLNKDKLNNKVQKRKLGENIPEVIEELTPEDMLSWAEFKLPEEILKALMESGFKNPTKIQQLTLPAAIHGRRDILGAAETGSGKTLAFGLPILTGIMKLKEKAKSGLNIYDIPYKKTSVKKKDQTTDKDNKNKQRKKKNKKIEQANAKESSEDGYGSDDETDEDVEEGSKTNDNEYIEEIEVPVRKRETASEDEGNNSDDSSNYVHLSEMLDSDDLADESDNKNDAQSSGDESANEDNLDVNNEEAEIENNEGIGCVRVVEDIEIPPHEAKRTGKPFFALILTPTRELAIQISRHLIAVAKYTGINVATIVGGMAAVKQERVLRRGPEVIVATPGRLWELISQGESHLQQIDTIKFLAIDETDRMVERGHFEELEPLLERLNADEARRGMRQNFVFSATLTMVHELPTHMRAKKVTKHGKIINRKIEKMTPEMKIKKLIQRIGMTDPKVVDITTKNLGTAETLTESRIACSLEHKDVYLYYILKRHPGRTIVFCNSIGCVKRLAQLFTLLKCRPLPLHASMPQRQRLKNLERFRDDQHGVLVATDVAARGLDIPNVDHVVHYQVPRTAENYVHRSGRTARANKEGLTILLMEPSEAHLYTKLCRTLNKTSELPTFPVTTHTFNSMSGLVSLARDVDALMLKRKRASQSQGWLDKAAKEMDMIIDDDDVQVKRVDPKIDKELRVKKRQLDSLLSKPMFPKGFSYKYPTLNDSDALLIKEEKALEAMKNSRRKLPKIKTTLNK